MSESTSVQRTLTYDGARRVLDAAIAEADRLGVRVCLAVTDRAGAALATARMDGAALISQQIATDKAWTVCGFNGLPTHEWFDMIKDEPALLHGIVHTDRLIVFAGGVPVLVDGVLVGAIGVSGGSAEQDRQVAEAGAAAAGG